MTRTAIAFSVIVLGLLVAPFAYANDRYDYDNDYDDTYYSYDYDYRSYDNSIDHSFNNYDSFNYSYGYPYSNYAYNNSYTYDYGYDGYYDTYYYDREYDEPECSISTYDTNGSYYGGATTLSWWSSDATSAYLSGVGSVNTSGSRTVNYQQGSYTLTVYGPGGSSVCSASSPFYDSGSNYNNRYDHSYSYTSHPAYAYPLYNYSTYSYPNYTYATPGYVYPTTSVTLNQIPYTGFDFGTLGNSLYWFAMVLVAAAGAYLIVYSHSGSYPRAFARQVAAAARNQVRWVRSRVF